MEATGNDTLIDAELVERVLSRALERGGDFTEVFCEQRSGFSLSIDESRGERAQRGAERGAGVRVVSGDTTYFAHVDGLAEPHRLRAGGAPPGARSGERPEGGALSGAEPPELQEVELAPEGVPAERKAELLRELDERGLAAGGGAPQFQGSLV